MIMNPKKYILTLAAVSTLFTGLVGCKKQLNEVGPQTSLDPNLILTDPGAANTLYHGVYASFRGYQSTLFILGEMRSDIWADGIFTESEDGGLKQYWSHNISQANAPAGSWANFYSLISRINTVIKLFPQAPLDEATKNRELAEMYGLRAYLYYTMLKTWGSVPIVTEPVPFVGSLSELYRGRSSKDSVMALVKSDIDKSLTLFGSENKFSPLSTKKVYWSRPATLTLKGDVYIWSGTHMGGGSADLTTAKAALEEVKAISVLGLQANYADVFDPTKEANNKEIIFAINYEKDQAQLNYYGSGSFSVNTTQAGTLVFDPPPVVVDGKTVNAVNNVYPFVAGANRVGFSSAMISKLNDPNDKRMKTTFRVMYGNTAPYATRGVILTKFIGRVDAGTQLYDNDFPIYRFADVLLLLAEAKTKLGEDPSPDINAVRQRAYGAGYTIFVNGNQSDNMNAILEEYLREFIGEGKRWWALRRAGDSFVFAAIKPTYLSSSQAYKLLLPLSVSMLNSDPQLKQTEGYN
jgi:hypothetical protein